jgi:hypothetical protein
MDKVTKEKLNRYFDLTRRAFQKIKVTDKDKELAEDFLDMAKRYYEDAKHFREKGDLVTAFAAVTYAHAWLDAGARSKLFDVGGDNELFVVDE